jgi:hypothetical protein
MRSSAVELTNLTSTTKLIFSLKGDAFNCEKGSANRGVDAVGPDTDAADEREVAAERLVERGEGCGVRDLSVLVVKKHSIAISISGFT